MSDYTTWHVGMKVVCVDDSPGPFGGSIRLGEVYTISRIEAHGFPEVAVQLAELNFRWDEYSRASRFRPVQPRKTSIASLEAILHGARVPEDA